MNLLQVEDNPDVNQYFDILTENNFTPLITCPTRITANSKTLIDNIFYNEFASNMISGNITVGISDHIPQFALIPNSSWRSNSTKSSARYGRKFNNINLDKFNQDLNKINWNEADLEDMNKYGNNFLHVFNQILDIHAPMKEIKQNKKRNQKMLNPGLQMTYLS